MIFLLLFCALPLREENSTSPAPTAAPHQSFPRRYLILCVAFVLVVAAAVFLILFCFTDCISGDDQDLKYTREILGDDAFEFSHIDAP